MQLMLSVEVAYSNGDLKLLIHRHDIGITLVNYTQESSGEIMWVLRHPTIPHIHWLGLVGPFITNRNRAASEGRPLEITFSGGFGFRINAREPDTQTFLDIENTLFFTNLSNVQVWYGGVRDDLLQRYNVTVLHDA